MNSVFSQLLFSASKDELSDYFNTDKQQKEKKKTDKQQQHLKIKYVKKNNLILLILRGRK